MPNADVDIGSAKVSITHALIGNVGDGNFRTSFMKSNISAIDRLYIVMKFHTNIANRWLFMKQRKIMAIVLYS